MQPTLQLNSNVNSKDLLNRTNVHRWLFMDSLINRPVSQLTEYQTKISKFWDVTFYSSAVLLFCLYSYIRIYTEAVMMIMMKPRLQSVEMVPEAHGASVKALIYCSLTVLSLFSCRNHDVGRRLWNFISLLSVFIALINGTSFPENKSCVQP